MRLETCSEKGLCHTLADRSRSFRTGGVKGFVWNSAEKGIVTRYSNGRDKGLVINFCPFCGFSFKELYAQGKIVLCR